MPPAEIIFIRSPSEAIEQQCAELLSRFREACPADQELLVAVARAVKGDLPGQMSDSPDALLIHLCARLCDIHAAIEAAYKAIPHDDATRDVILDQLNPRWFEVKNQIFKCPAPSTQEGARAAASALLTQHPEGLAGAMEGTDLLSWLSIGCAQYLAGQN